MNTLEIAQSWIAAGQSVIPIGYRSKRPAFDALRLAGCVTEDHLTWDPFKTRAATAAELRLWFTGPRRNLGVVTGWGGLVVLDFDMVDAYTSWLTWAAAEGGLAARVSASTYRVFSARGVHVYVICEEPVESYAVPGVDVKGKWGFVVAPPSTHPSGYVYRGQGDEILRCGKLAEVFPFGKPAPACGMETARGPLSSDPWEAASCAVDCGGDGSVVKAKAALRIEDMLRLDPGRVRQMVLCPFHSDHNPSMVVDLNKQNYRCFGCGAAGDSLDMYAFLHKITIREAIAEVTRR